MQLIEEREGLFGAYGSTDVVAPAAAMSSHLELQIGNRKSVLEIVCGFWNLKAQPQGHTSSTKFIPPNPAKQCSQLETKYSDTQEYGQYAIQTTTNAQLNIN